MLLLAINTASKKESVALISGKKVLAEISWMGNMDESEKLAPAISDLLKKANRPLNEIEAIAVVCGPGPFSAVRIGVTVANTLAKILDVPMRPQIFEIDTPSLYWLRLQNPKTQTVLLLHAGGNFVSTFFQKRHQKKSAGILPIKEALKLTAKRFKTKSLAFFGDITENEMREFSEAKRRNWRFLDEDELKKFGEVVAFAPARSFKKVKLAAPIYCRPPHITISKKL